MADRTGFEEFVAARSARLLRVCYLLTRDWAAAEDLLQTALAKAWFGWDRIREEPESYVRAVIANTYASWWRRRWRGELPTAQLPEHAAVQVVDDVDDRDEMWAALGRLPRRQRAVVVLRFYEDLSERQTADALGVSVGTVKSQTSKALATLRIDPVLADGRRGDERAGDTRAQAAVEECPSGIREELS
jgi:RNA polymerase sigma-70 factor (sigma-E family)